MRRFLDGRLGFLAALAILSLLISASAQAAPQYSTITATAGANGAISPSGAVSVQKNRDQSFAITSNAGYTVANVVVDGG
jgi:hypothetical protein